MLVLPPPQQSRLNASPRIAQQREGATFTETPKTTEQITAIAKFLLLKGQDKADAFFTGFGSLMNNKDGFAGEVSSLIAETSDRTSCAFLRVSTITDIQTASHNDFVENFTNEGGVKMFEYQNINDNSKSEIAFLTTIEDSHSVEEIADRFNALIKFINRYEETPAQRIDASLSTPQNDHIKRRVESLFPKQSTP